jgi:ABC-type uncharacterized transport system substrate-binding protein
MLFLTLAVGTGCGPGREPVMVFCSPDSARLHQVVAGLEAGLGQGPLKVVCAPELGPEGEKTFIQLRQRRPRLLVVLGTPALILAARKEKRLPVVFAMVGNPYFSGGAYDPRHPEIHQENVTGLASPPPLAAALEQGARLLGPCSWGLLYDPLDGQAAALAEQFATLAPRLGLQPLLEPSTGAAGDAPGLRRLMARGARVLYLPPAASAGRYAPLVLARGREMQALVVSSYPEGPHKGAVLFVALDYRRLGEETAALARRVLQGEKPAKIPITEETPLQVEVDETLLKRWSGYPPVRKGREALGGVGQGPQAPAPSPQAPSPKPL